MKEQITTQQMQLLEALVQAPNVQAACESVGVGRTTAYRWMDEPAFKAELDRQRDLVLSVALEGVKTSATRAMTELTALMGTKDERLRRQVCNDVLTHAMKIRELDDFERRLVAIERALIKTEPKKWNNEEYNEA